MNNNIKVENKSLNNSWFCTVTFLWNSLFCYSIIKFVLKALVTINICWKNCGSTNLNNQSNSASFIRISLLVFFVDSNRYLGCFLDAAGDFVYSSIVSSEDACKSDCQSSYQFYSFHIDQGNVLNSVHQSWKLEWAFQIACRQFVRPYVYKLSMFSQFQPNLAQSTLGWWDFTLCTNERQRPFQR